MPLYSQLLVYQLSPIGSHIGFLGFGNVNKGNNNLTKLFHIKVKFSVVMVLLFSRSIGVAQCFIKKSVVGSGFGVYTCSPSAAVWLL